MTQFLVVALMLSVAFNGFFAGVFTAYESKMRGEIKERDEEIY
ncbi:hypothetical protein [Aerococcus urinae]|nr:hypothetical protein [Aerococcus urinae]MDK7716058.1 hypothetical protein [Aerococcus urinae]